MLASTSRWISTVSPKRPNVLEIAYGTGTHFPQVAALHTDSSYLRLTGGWGTTWGTSVILLPVVWQRGHSGPTQGARIQILSCQEEATAFLVDFAGRIAGLSVTGQLRFYPPTVTRFQVDVAVSVSGDTPLSAVHAPEAFKTVMLSSMHVSPEWWDTDRAFVGRTQVNLPAPERWIVSPSLSAPSFGLRGGRSRWQHGKVAPTLSIAAFEILPVAGWISSPGKGRKGGCNSDNVALWAAYEHVRSSWRYTITAQHNPHGGLKRAD